MLCHFFLFSALLPSTFTMYTTTLAMSFALYPSSLSSNFNLKSTWKGTKGLIPSMTLPQTIPSRTFKATLLFALGALVGWPFSIILSLPFVFEELFLYSGDVNILASSVLSLFISRFKRFTLSALSSALIILPFLISIDSIAYGRFTLVPFNIISYNLLSSERGAGPELYGTEPWWYYGANLTLAFNLLLPLAALSAPLVLLSNFKSSDRDLSLKFEKDNKTDAPKDGSSPLLLLLVRLAPAYLWIGLLSLQAHKEERFVYPAYPLICFNAAVGLSASHSILERLWTFIFSKSTSSPSKSSPPFINYLFIIPILLATSIISLFRITALSTYYKAPFQVLQDLNSIERSSESNPSISKTICFGQEWYRFPSHFFLPSSFRAEFIKSDFEGILPAHFGWKRERESKRESSENGKDMFVERLDKVSSLIGLEWKRKDETRALGGSFNDLNQEEIDRYVSSKANHLERDVDLLIFSPLFTSRLLFCYLSVDSIVGV